MGILILIIVLLIGAGLFFSRQRTRNDGLNPAELEDAKRRIEALEKRARTQFVATPGDKRLKPDWEYMVALKKKGEETFTFTYFTQSGISHTQSGMSTQAIDDMTQQGWFINGQTFNDEGMSWQLERPAKPSQ